MWSVFCCVYKNYKYCKKKQELRSDPMNVGAAAGGANNHKAGAELEAGDRIGQGN